MPFRSILTSALQSAGLMIAGFLVPVIGQITLLIAPVPLILIMVREGKLPGMLAVGLATAIIAVLAGGQAVFVVIFLSFGFMAMGLADGLRWRWKPENAVLIGAILTIVALVVVLTPFLSSTEKGLVTVAEDYLRTSLAEAQQLYTQLGLTEVAQMMAQVTDTVVYYLVRLLPGIILATTLLQAACCYGVARSLILRKDPAAAVLSEPSLAAWHAPDSWVWGLILTLGLVALPDVTIRFIGMNLALVFLLVYSVQGLALVEFTLRKAKVGTIWRSMILTFIVALPVIVPVIALGVVDIFADFRKVRTPAQTP
ncbi:MAG: DUF2232 domain-containing protein [Nitrospirota bacterium]